MQKCLECGLEFATTVGAIAHVQVPCSKDARLRIAGPDLLRASKAALELIGDRRADSVTMKVYEDLMCAISKAEDKPNE